MKWNERLVIENELVKNRESTTLEFKKSFSKDIGTYIKTIFAFANNKGGCIIFGVTDKPRKPVGLVKNKINALNDWDNAKIGELISTFTDSEIDFTLDTFVINDLVFGILTVKTHHKPVICKKADSKAATREGAIYYRYSAHNKEIKYVDLVNLLQEEKDRELNRWRNLLSKAATIGIDNVGLLSVKEGELDFGNSNFIIDGELLQKIKFIKEGHFVTNNGAPALMLKGEIEGLEAARIITRDVDPNKTHPFEGITSAINELKKDEEIKNILIENDRIYISYANRHMSIKFILQQMSTKEDIKSKPELFWSNKRGNDKKYSNRYIDFCKAYLLDEDKLGELYDWYNKNKVKKITRLSKNK